MKGKTVRKEKQISLCGNVVRTAFLARLRVVLAGESGVCRATV